MSSLEQMHRMVDHLRQFVFACNAPWRRLIAVGLACALILTIAGSATAQIPTDAISREFTVYVDQATYPPITDAMTPEFTVYVGTQPLRVQTDCVSREFTVYLDPVVAAGIKDAISREFTVYTGTQPLREQVDCVSREFTVLVPEADPILGDAFSREFTIYVGTQPLREQVDCVSREFTVTTYPQGYADLNCDSLANGRDVQAFTTAVLSPSSYPTLYPGCDILRGDMDLNGIVNYADVVGFVNLLLGP